MSRIRWYGPTLVLLGTVLVVMVLAPVMAERLAAVHHETKIKLVREDLADSPTLEALSRDFRKVADVVRPSVVSIQTATRQTASPTQRRIPEELRRFFGPDLGEPDESPGSDMERFNVPQEMGAGSGWVYDDQGHIVTNYHVVANADVITVRFEDKTEMNATLVAYDRETDIAVIKVTARRLYPAARATEPVEQGDIVFAFGSPFRFDFSMSQGIVSAKGRRVGLIAAGQGYESFIQTDAAINPGNSGGPLTNIRGEVIGMNTAIASRTGVFNGIGLAIPIVMVDDVVKQLIAEGRVVRGYLGVFIRDLTSAQARTFGFDRASVLVADEPIARSPAAGAGIRRGDIIVGVDDEDVFTVDELRNLIAGYRPGTRVDVRIFRDGRVQSLPMTIDEKPSSDQLASGRVIPAPQLETDDRVLQRLGFLRVVPFTETLAERVNMDHRAGVFVDAVRSRSAAASAGMRRGMVITQVMGRDTPTVEAFVAELKRVESGEMLRLSVFDGQRESFAFMEMPAGD